MKLRSICLLTLLATPAIAGNEEYTPATVPAPDAFHSGGFEDAIRPITNPTLFDLAVPRTQVHAIFMHNEHPNFLSTDLGLLPVGGDFQLYALQLEYAFNERFSFVATKDGYIDFNPDATLTPSSGFANLAAGLKYALIYRPEDQFILSGIATVELPTGDSDVWQGEGDGALNLILTDLKRWDRLQTAGAIGIHVPFDDAESFTGFMSAHVSYEISPWFIPLLELNWYHVIDEGDSTIAFSGQPVNGVASPTFEGGDLVNFGSAAAGINDDIVTFGVGFRSRLSDDVTAGFVWEMPLTDEEENLMDNRFTIDLVWEL